MVELEKVDRKYTTSEIGKWHTGTVTKPSDTLLIMMLTVYRRLKANRIRVSRKFSLGGGDDDPARMYMILPIEPQRA